jgi:hypothetical protein
MLFQNVCTVDLHAPSLGGSPAVGPASRARHRALLDPLQVPSVRVEVGGNLPGRGGDRSYAKRRGLVNQTCRRVYSGVSGLDHVILV